MYPYSQLLLLGAMEGLFVVDLVSSTMRRQVPGIAAVFQVGLVTGTGVALAICGELPTPKLE